MNASAFSIEGSETSTPSSAPIASPCLIASRALAGPIESTVILPWPWASLIRNAASTACASNGLITGATPCAGTTLLLAVSTLNAAAGVSGSGTCLTHTMMFTSQVLLVLSPYSCECSEPPPMPLRPNARTAAGDRSVPLFYHGVPPSYVPIGGAYRSAGGRQCSLRHRGTGGASPSN